MANLWKTISLCYGLWLITARLFDDYEDDTWCWTVEVRDGMGRTVMTSLPYEDEGHAIEEGLRFINEQHIQVDG